MIFGIVLLIQGFPPKTNLLYPLAVVVVATYARRQDSFTTTYNDRIVFANAITNVLQKHYRLEAESKITLLFRPKSSLNRFFENDIFVEFGEGIAIIHCGVNMKAKLQRELVGKGL